MEEIEDYNLSSKQQRFVEEYLVDSNGTQAAIRAGYSEATSPEQASRLLTKANVKQAISAARRDLKCRSVMDAEWKRQKLRELIEAGMTTNMDVRGNLKPANGMLAARCLELLCKLDGEFPANGSMNLLSDNPIHDLLNQIAQKALETGPIRGKLPSTEES